jgi:uncharacterized membrane protein YozB (DUF420 family)
MTFSDLPTVNASLNALCTIFLTVGYVFIRKGKRDAHRNCMIAAFITSAIFLACYLTYHFTTHLVTKFQGEGWSRPVYFFILISHSILAPIIVPLVLMTLSRGLKQRWDAHRKIARWTWPLWMYVSVTGVIVYAMLYHLYPAK